MGIPSPRTVPSLLGEELAVTLVLSVQSYCLVYELCALNPSLS